MYKSPIELMITDIQHQIVKQQDEEIYQAVLNFIPNVNKDELLRALQYDRQQYDQGYEDGKRDARDELVYCKDCASKVHDNASDEDWCNNPGGLCCRLRDEYFCPFGERREQ